MPMAEKAIKELKRLYTNAYGKERTDHKCLWQSERSKIKPQMLVANEKWLP